jgi:hypothetical protein
MTREDIIKMAREAKMPFYFRTGEIDNIDAVERFARLVAEKEREACAKVCEELSDSAHALWKVDADPTEQGRDIGAEHCAQAIRARGGEK